MNIKTLKRIAPMLNIKRLSELLDIDIQALKRMIKIEKELDVATAVRLDSILTGYGITVDEIVSIIESETSFEQELKELLNDAYDAVHNWCKDNWWFPIEKPYEKFLEYMSESCRQRYNYCNKLDSSTTAQQLERVCNIANDYFEDVFVEDIEE